MIVRSRIEFGTSMELIDKTITEIVSEHNSAARVFDKYHLDFCCNGAARRIITIKG